MLFTGNFDRGSGMAGCLGLVRLSRGAVQGPHRHVRAESPLCSSWVSWFWPVNMKIA